MKYLNFSKKSEQTNNREFWFCVICVIFLATSHILGKTAFVVLSIVMYLCIIAFCHPNKIIPCILFFLPWAPIIKLTPNTITFTSVATLVLIIRYILMGWNLDRKNLAPMILLLIFTLGSKLIHGYSINTEYIMFFATMLMLSYLLPNIKDKTEFEKCIVYYSTGIILAAIIAIIFQDNRNIKDFINIQSDAYIAKRMTGFIGDANFYSAQIVPAFAGTLIIICHNRRKTVRYAILAIILAGVGVVAVSKSFLICISLVFMCFILNMIRTNRRGILKLIPIVGLFVVIVISSSFFSYIIESYTTRFSLATNMEKLTTGRDVLWQDYLGYIMTNPIELILGQGLTPVVLVRQASHNSIIQSLYQFGVVGCGFLSFWIYKMIKNQSNIYRITMLILWIIGCFSMWQGLDILFFDDFFCIMALFSIGIKELSMYKEDSDHNEINRISKSRYFV